eukprot:scaffold17463_cov66-Phaeocystis_antarctica.AAC.4
MALDPRRPAAGQRPRRQLDAEDAVAVGDHSFASILPPTYGILWLCARFGVPVRLGVGTNRTPDFQWDVLDGRCRCRSQLHGGYARQQRARQLQNCARVPIRPCCLVRVRRRGRVGVARGGQSAASVQAVDHVDSLGGSPWLGRRLIGAVLCRRMLWRPPVQRSRGEAAHRVVVVVAVIGLGDRLGGWRRLPRRALRRTYVGPAVLNGRLGRGGRRRQLGRRAPGGRRPWLTRLRRVEQVRL